MDAKPTLLFVPGWHGSGPNHWQTRWAKNHSRAVNLRQADWDRPDKSAWLEQLESTVQEIPGPVILIAHSLGCSLVAHYAASAPDSLLGALLVAPVDLERDDLPGEITSFRPLPLDPLPFPSILISSQNDPWCAPERAKEYGDAWGSTVMSAGEAGHINEESGFGPWPEGLYVLADLLKRAKQA